MCTYINKCLLNPLKHHIPARKTLKLVVANKHLKRALLMPSPPFRLNIRPIVHRLVKPHHHRASRHINALLQYIGRDHNVDFPLDKVTDHLAVHLSDIHALASLIVRVRIEADYKIRVYFGEGRDILFETLKNEVQNLGGEATLDKNEAAQRLVSFDCVKNCLH